MRPRTLVLTALILAIGCGGPTTPTITRNTTGPVDQVTILSAQPPAGSTLARGSSVTFTFRFSYELVGGDTGYIGLVIQDQRNQVLNGGSQPTVSVARGTGTSELSASLTVPTSADVTLINVFLPLFFGGQHTSGHMDMVQYPVR